ncbi:MAG: hypothetical protein AAF399_14650 [Bacteroidota bacterium]
MATQPIPEKYQALIDHGYQFNFSEYLSRGWQLFTQQAGLLIGFTLVYFAIMLVAGFIPFGGVVIGPPLIAGFYLFIAKTAKGQEVSFGDFFQGFSNIGPLILVYFISTLLTLFGFVFLIIPGIYLAVSYMLAIQFVVHDNMDFWPAMETSRQLIGKNWFAFLGLALFFFLIIMAGMFMLFVGILAAMPLIYCISYAVYEDLAGVEDDQLVAKIEEIGEDEEDIFSGIDD